MTPKQEAALRQAREALQYVYEGANNQGPHTGISWRCASNKVEPVIAAIDEALAEQPAQQQEPVAKVCHDLDGHIGWNPKLTQLPDEGTSLYISSQPSKPLTDGQRKAIVVCFTSGKVSVSEVQRKLAISYNEAQQLCQSIVDLGLAEGLQLAPSLDRHGIKGDA